MATAIFAGTELWMMRAETPADLAVAMRWVHVPIWLAVRSFAPTSIAHATCRVRVRRASPRRGLTIWDFAVRGRHGNHLLLIRKGETVMKLFKALILCVAALAAVPAFAQDKPADTNMQILLEKVKADKKLVRAGEAVD
jgi:hypothetical protein